MVETPEVYDLTGLRCPLPLLKMKKRLNAMTAPAILTVISDDPLAEIDLAHFCRTRGFVFQTIKKENRLYFTVWL